MNLDMDGRHYRAQSEYKSLYILSVAIHKYFDVCNIAKNTSNAMRACQN